MKLICQRDLLQKSVGIVEKAISSRTSLPVLENLYFELSNGALKMRGNDLEIGIEYSIPVESSQLDGQILVKSKTFSSIISKLPEKDVSLDLVSDNQLVLKSGHVDFDILCQSTEEYPVFPSIEDGVQLSLKVGELLSLIKHTIFSVSFDETKHFLNGILVKSEEDHLYFVSTDGYRLALKKKKIEALDKDFSQIVPFKAMSELSKIIQMLDDDQEITMTVSDNQVAFQVDQFVLVSRVIKGQFPDYRQVVPKESEHLFSLPRKTLLDAADRAQIIASASNNVVRFSFTEDRVVLTANAAGLGDFKEDFTIVRSKGEGDAKIAFNIRLVLDVLKQLVSDDLTVEFNNGLSPCVVQSMNDDSFIYIIMPIRTSEFQQSAEVASETPSAEGVEAY